MRKKLNNLVKAIIMIFISSLSDILILIAKKLFHETFKFQDFNYESFKIIYELSFYFPLWFLFLHSRIKLRLLTLITGIILAICYFIFYFYAKDDSKALDKLLFKILLILIGQCSSAFFITGFISNLQIFKFKNVAYLLSIFLCVGNSNLNTLIYNYVNIKNKRIQGFFNKLFFLPFIIIITTILFYFTSIDETKTDLFYSKEKCQYNYQKFKEKWIIKAIFFSNFLCFLAMIIIFKVLSNYDFSYLIYADLYYLIFLLLNLLFLVIEKAKLFDDYLLRKFITHKSNNAPNDKPKNESVFEIRIENTYKDKEDENNLCFQNIKALNEGNLGALKEEFNNEQQLKNDFVHEEKQKFLTKNDNCNALNNVDFKITPTKDKEGKDDFNNGSVSGNNELRNQLDVTSKEEAKNNLSNSSDLDKENKQLNISKEILNLSNIQNENLIPINFSNEKNEFLTINNVYSSPNFIPNNKGKENIIITEGELDLKLYEFDVLPSETLNKDNQNLHSKLPNPEALRKTMPTKSFISEDFINSKNEKANNQIPKNQSYLHDLINTNLIKKESLTDLNRNTVHITVGMKPTKKINFDKFYDYTIPSSESEISERNSLESLKQNKGHLSNSKAIKGKNLNLICKPFAASNEKISSNLNFENKNLEKDSSKISLLDNSNPFQTSCLVSLITHSQEQTVSLPLKAALKTWNFFYLCFNLFVISGLAKAVLNNYHKIIILNHLISYDKSNIEEDEMLRDEAFNLAFYSFIAINFSVYVSALIVNKTNLKNFKFLDLLILNGILTLIAQVLGLFQSLETFRICVILSSINLGVNLLLTLLFIRIKYGSKFLPSYFCFLFVCLCFGYLLFSMLIFNSRIDLYLKRNSGLDIKDSLKRFYQSYDFSFFIGILFSLLALFSSFKLHKKESNNLEMSLL